MFKLIRIDNKESAGADFVGEIGNFSFNGNIFFFCNLRSSKVEIINRIDDELIVKTKNSKYVFEKQ